MRTFAKIETLYEKIHYSFKDEQYLHTALTHSSFAKDNYERYEFLGDALLNCIIAELLFVQFPSATEGQLTRLRASLVNGDALAKIAAQFTLDQYVKLGSGELKSGGHKRPSIMADMMEAITAAIYLDSDFTTVKEVVYAWYKVRLDDLDPDHQAKDPKSQLQEFAQSEKVSLPAYEVCRITGKEHDRMYEVTCQFKNISVQAKGRSRRRAEQAAAKLVLNMMVDQNDS